MRANRRDDASPKKTLDFPCVCMPGAHMKFDDGMPHHYNLALSGPLSIRYGKGMPNPSERSWRTQMRKRYAMTIEEGLWGDMRGSAEWTNAKLQTKEEEI